MTSTVAPAGAGRQIPIVCPGHTRPLAELQFLTVKDNVTLLMSACHDKLPMVRDGVTGDWIGTLAGHKGAVWSCRMDPSGSLAATASGDFSVKVWDGITGQPLLEFPHEHIVKCCDFSPNSLLLATGGHEGILRIYDLNQPKKAPLCIEQAKGQKVTISKLNWYDNETVITASADGVIRFWKIHSVDAPMQTLAVKADVRDMELLTLAATGQEMLTVAAGDRVYFFDLGDMKLLHEYPMPIHFKDVRIFLHVPCSSDVSLRVFYRTCSIGHDCD